VFRISGSGKGLAIDTAYELVLVILVGGIVAVALGGPIMDQMEQGFGLLGEMNTGGNRINVSNRATLSQATLYVYQRASNDGCFDPDSSSSSYDSPTVPEQVDGDLTPPEGIDEAGYPALQDTYLTSEPPCTATQDPEGRDMEGTYSRVNFVIDETRSDPIVVGGGNEWMDDKAQGAVRGSIYDRTKAQCSKDVLDAAVNGGATGMVIGATASGGNPIITLGTTTLGMAGATISEAASAGYIGTNNNFLVYFPESISDTRSDSWLSDADEQDFSERIYCYGLDSNIDLKGGSLVSSPLDQTYNHDFGNDVIIKLCPGDRGYIQMNKQSPQNKGEAGEDWGSAHNFLFMEVTSTKTDSCGGPSVATPSELNEQNLQQLSSTPDSHDFGDGNTQVLEDRSNGVMFTPSDSSGNDEMVWDNLPSGDKEFEVTVEFQDRGHFRIDAENSNGRVTNVNTDARGQDKFWMYCYVCDDQSSNFQDPGGTSGDRYGIVWNYQSGEEYTFILRRNGDDVEWEIKDSIGNTEYFFSKEMNDFTEIQVEAWDDWASGDTEESDILIKDIELN
jgi:hypothetical protein